MNYPVVEIPTGIALIVEKNEFSIRKPEKEQVKEEEVPSFDSEEGYWVSMGWPIIIFSFLLILFIGIPSIVTNTEGGDIVIVPSLILMGYAYIKMREEKEKMEYDQKMNKAMQGANLLANISAQANINAKYNKELLEYHSKVFELEKLGKEGYRKKLLREYFQKCTAEPSVINTDVKKGKSEKGFYFTLKEYFGDYISNNLGIAEDQDSRTYVPDMVYHNPKSGICIDIEIDERKTSSGEVIHYQGSMHDINRNEFFLLRSWLVIRFAEDQVMNDASGCIVFLHKILRKFDPDYLESTNTKAVSEIVPEVKEIPRWNKPKKGWIDDDDLPF